MQLLISIGAVWATPQIGEILPPCDFSDCTVLTFFSILRLSRTTGPIFTLYGSNDVFPRRDGPLGGENDGQPHLDEIYDQNSQKWA